MYKYSIDNGISSKSGFKKKSIKAYILLSETGKFIGFDPGSSEKVMCPNIGSAAQGPTKCNFIAEKAGIVLGMGTKSNEITKRNFYLQMLGLAKVSEPLFAICERALTGKEQLDNMQTAFEKSKYKAADVLSLQVGEMRLEQSKQYYDWWDEFRTSRADNNGTKATKKQARCMITGALTTPSGTVPKVSGLRVVGGHSSGDALICFDKPAFCSYGLEQAANAAVSEKAIAAINAVLETMLRDAPSLAGTKFVHWYKKEVPKELDFLTLFNDQAFKFDEPDEPDEEMAEESHEVNKAALKSQADQLIKSIEDGIAPEKLDNIYYILMLSGASGRIMVRSYLQGSYEDLYNNFKQWFSDLHIVSANGKGFTRVPKLYAMYFRLLKVEKSTQNTSDRMAKELSGLDMQIKFSIINNTPLPDNVAMKALNYIRSKMLESSESSNENTPDTVACQWLKVWLNRRNRQQGGENVIQESLNQHNPSIAYQAGRMMTVYAAIQADALGRDLGAGIIQRYYASASTSPALVLGKLSVLSQYHLSKIENKAFVNRYERMLSEIAIQIGTSLPTTLNLEKQSQFALGYYQQRAAIYTSKTKD